LAWKKKAIIRVTPDFLILLYLSAINFMTACLTDEYREFCAELNLSVALHNYGFLAKADGQN
jgi:hypothetical protein